MEPMQTDIGIIIAIVGTGIAIVGVVLAMMFWSRQEANSLRSDAKEDRKDLINLCREIQDEGRNFREALQTEIKDFHYRLLEIEKKKIKEK